MTSAVDLSIDPSLGPIVDLAGVVRYDETRARRGYRLTSFLVSLRYPVRRAAFAQDPVSAMTAAQLSDTEQDLVLRRDYDGMLDYGASIYGIGKAGLALETDLIGIGAKSRGEAREEFLLRRLGRKEP